MTVVRLEPDANGATSNWTKEGVKANWEEVAQPTMQFAKKLKDGTTEEETVTEKKPTEAEGKARGVKSSTPSQVQQFKVSAAQVEAKIPAGATINRIVFRWFGKPASTQDIDQLEFGTLTEEMKIGGLAEVFHTGTVTKAHVEATTRASLIEKLQFQYQHATEGAGESRINVFYVEVEYTAAAAATVKITGKVTFAGTAKLAQAQEAKATGKALFAGSAKAVQSQNTTLTGKTIFQGAAVGAQTQAAKLTGKALFAGQVQPQQVQALTAQTKTRFQGSVAAVQAQGVTGQTQVRFAGTMSFAQRVLVAVQGAVRFAGRVTVSVPGLLKRAPGRFMVWFEEEDI